MPGTTSTTLPSFSHDQHHETDAAQRKGAISIRGRPGKHFSHIYRVGQIKRRLSFLVLTTECVYKIQRFLAITNCLTQQVVLCKFYPNES